MLKYIPYVLMFAVATMIIYGWGLWRTMHQKQDLSNMLCSKGNLQSQKSARKKIKIADKKRTGTLCKRSDRKTAVQQRANRSDRSKCFP